MNDVTMKRCVDKLARMWALNIITKSKHKQYNLFNEYNLSYIESDRRKHTKILKELVEHGYVKFVENEDDNSVNEHRLTSAAFNEVLNRVPQPPLVFPAIEAEAKPGARFNQSMPVEVYCRVAAQCDREGAFVFTCVRNSAMYEETVVDPAEYLTSPSNKYWNCDLYVATPKFLAEVSKAKEVRQFDRTVNNNVDWGLRELGIVAKESKSKFTSPFDYDNTAHLFGYEYYKLSKDPAEWAVSFTKNFEKLLAEIERLQEIREEFAALGVQISRYGGWAKFVADYKVLLAKEIAKQKKSSE